MSVLAMSVNVWGKKAASITAILVLGALVATWVGSFIPTYAKAADLADHIKLSDDWRYRVIKRHYEEEIQRTENAIALYGLDRSTRPLTPREALHESQLINLKAQYLRKSEGLSPR